MSLVVIYFGFRDDGEPLNLKEFIGSLDVPVIAGGVTDYTTALHLMRTGAAGVIVGAGVTTNAETVGIDSAMGTAIADAAAARRDYLDETGGRYVHIIADTEFENSGNIAKAFACGADGVALGPLLAQAREAGGPLTVPDTLLKTTTLPTYMTGDLTRDWGELQQYAPLADDAPAANLTVGVQTRSGWWRQGPIRALTNQTVKN